MNKIILIAVSLFWVCFSFAQPVINIKDYGALSDGKSHPLKTKYKYLSNARSTYPAATSLETEINDVAFEKAKAFALSILSTTKRIYFPAGMYITSHSLLVGNGDQAISVELVGEETYPYDAGSSVMKGAVIYCTSKSEPGIVLQGVRNALIKGLTIIGQNNATVDEYSQDCTNPEAYLESWVDDTRNTRYAGIVIDPDPTKIASSVLHIEQCYIRSWCIGILSLSQVNGDFFTFSGNYIRACKYGISITGGQARNTNILYNQINQVYTAITTADHGQGWGRVTLVQGNHFSGYQIYNIGNSAWNGPLTDLANYGEGLFIIGSIGNGGMDAGGVTISGADYNFNHSDIGISPLFIITSSTSMHGVKFSNCRFGGLSFNVNAGHQVIFEYCQFTYKYSNNTYGGLYPMSSVLWRNANNVFAHGKENIANCVTAVSEQQLQEYYKGKAGLNVPSSAFIYDQPGLGLSGLNLKFRLKNENLDLLKVGAVMYSDYGYGFLVTEKSEDAIFTAVLLNGYKLNIKNSMFDSYLFDPSTLNKLTTTIY